MSNQSCCVKNQPFSIPVIQTSYASPPFGSFEFTPEGYAKTCYWRPEDGFTWDDFKKQNLGASSPEEYEAKFAEFKTQNAGKLRITNHLDWEGSLRTIFPDRWLVAYTSDTAWEETDGKKVPLYSRLKRTLLFKSVILGYGEGPLHKAPSKEVVMYVKKHCASSARLKAIALRAYESVANMRGYGTWTSASPPVFLCLAAAKSSLDAMAAVLWALLFKKLPTGNLPSMGSLYWGLKKDGHSFSSEFSKLYESPWFTRLQGARDSVIHQSASPVVHDKFGAAFDFDLGLFKEMQPNKLHIGKPRVGTEKKTKRIHLDKIMKGYVGDLEKWEKKIALKLHKIAWFTSDNTDGVLMGIDFNDYNLLRDGTGPSHMITSHTQGAGSKFHFVGLHPFHKSPNRPRSAPAKASP